jgi:uncharacterized protein involved in exopolysaccharide biosynthesis
VISEEQVISEDRSLTRESRDEIDVIAILKVIWRYKYFIALVAALFVLIAIYVALSTTPVFRAEVVVTKARDESIGRGASLASQFGGLMGIAGLRLGQGGQSYEDQAVLLSRHLAEEFVKRNELVTELVSNVEGAATLWFAVNSFRDQVLSIRSDDDLGTTTISIKWTDPNVAARWANEYVGLANELIRTRALDDASRNIKYLQDQIAKTDVVEIQRVMYSLVEAETKTLMLANARQEYAFTVVDPAVAPERRIWPRRSLMVLTGGVLGIFAGVALAFAHSLWRRFRLQK